MTYNQKEYKKTYYIENKTRMNKQSLDWYYSNREKSIQDRGNYQMFQNFGITPIQYNEMVAKQDNKCAICKTDKPGGKGRWHIDHCHKTNVVRGLLCQKCNMGMGHFGDNVEVLQKAINYLTGFEYNNAGNCEWL
jgi:hypothetical protein